MDRDSARNGWSRMRSLDTAYRAPGSAVCCVRLEESSTPRTRPLSTRTSLGESFRPLLASSLTFLLLTGPTMHTTPSSTRKSHTAGLVELLRIM